MSQKYISNRYLIVVEYVDFLNDFMNNKFTWFVFDDPSR